MTRATVSAIIPCLDEETTIAAVVSAVLAQGVQEVIVVDGGSSDHTAERARMAGAKVAAQPQRGYGSAIQAGIAVARADADILLFLDGDGSDRPEMIPGIDRTDCERQSGIRPRHACARRARPG